jgi:hypothetical protein
MLRKWIYVLLLAIISLTANAQLVSDKKTHSQDLIGVRYRSFANTGGSELFLGVHNLGKRHTRSERDIHWVRGQNRVTFTLDPTADQLVTTVTNSAGRYTLAYPNVSQRVAGLKGGKFTLAQLNVLTLSIDNGDKKAHVAVREFSLDHQPLGDFTSHKKEAWTVSQVCFGHGFTLTGIIDL